MLEKANNQKYPRAPMPWGLYRAAIWIFALASVVLWSIDSNPISAHDLLILVMIIILGNLADIFAVQIQTGMRVSSAHFAAPFSIVATTALGGLVAAVGCLLGRILINRRDWNAFDMAVNLSATSVAASVWEISNAISNNSAIVPSVLTVVVFAAVRSVINLGWANEARARGMSIPPVSVPIGRLMFAAALLFTPAMTLISLEAAGVFGAVLLLTLPFLATQFLIRQFGRENSLNAQLEAANLSLTEALVNALDARDPFSRGHSLAVAVYSRDIAKEIGLSHNDVQATYLAGLLHDIGKIAVPDAILSKPAALTDNEFDEIRLHPEIGEQILMPSKHLKNLLPGIRHHHERLDGKGYPDKLRDANIPLQARIISVADAYNAMTSNRPYRDAMSPDLAQRILVQNQGMQHDPFLVAAFLRILSKNDFNYAMAHGPEFASSTNVSELISRLHNTEHLAIHNASRLIDNRKAV